MQNRNVPRQLIPLLGVCRSCEQSPGINTVLYQCTIVTTVPAFAAVRCFEDLLPPTVKDHEQEFFCVYVIAQNKQLIIRAVAIGSEVDLSSIEKLRNGYLKRQAFADHKF